MQPALTSNPNPRPSSWEYSDLVLRFSRVITQVQIYVNPCCIVVIHFSLPRLFLQLAYRKRGDDQLIRVGNPIHKTLNLRYQSQDTSPCKGVTITISDLECAIKMLFSLLKKGDYQAASPWGPRYLMMNKLISR